MSDQPKRIAIGSADEFLMLNIALPGLDLSSLDPGQVISLTWTGGIQILLRLLSKWKIKEDDQARILGISCDTLKAWKSNADVPATDGVIARCRSLFRIHMAILVLFPTQHNSDDIGHQWLHASNPHFNKESPVNHMIENGPADVEQYLFAAMQH